MVNLDLDQFQEQTVLLKKQFRDKHPKFENRFKWLEEKLTEQIQVIEEQNSLDKSTIPELDFYRIENGDVEEGVIKHHGKKWWEEDQKGVNQQLFDAGGRDSCHHLLIVNRR